MVPAAWCSTIKLPWIKLVPVPAHGLVPQLRSNASHLTGPLVVAVLWPLSFHTYAQATIEWHEPPYRRTPLRHTTPDGRAITTAVPVFTSQLYIQVSVCPNNIPSVLSTKESGKLTNRNILCIQDIYIYSKTSLNRPTTVPTICGPFWEVVGISS